MVVTLHIHTQRGTSDAPFYGKFPGKRILQEKDLLRFGLPPLEKVPLGKRNPEPIGKFIDQHHALGGDIRLHGTTFHQAGLEEKKSYTEE